MTLITRSAKGSPLLHTEVDGNWTHCSPTSGTTQENLDLKGTLAAPNTWTKANRGAYQALTSSAASIAIDLSLSNNFSHTLTEDTTLAAPSNAVAGQGGIIQFTQHSSAPKTLAFNAFWKWPAGTDGTLTATNSAVDVMSYVVSADATFATCVLIGDVK